MESFITNQNDLFVYFEVIKQLSPSSVLDVGMLLKRAGAVSRQVADSKLDSHVYLTGIDLLSEYRLPIYDRIYDRIISQAEFPDVAELQYDLVILLGFSSIPSFFSLEYLKEHTNWILTSYHIKNALLSCFSAKNAREIQLEDDKYLLIRTKS